MESNHLESHVRLQGTVAFIDLKGELNAQGDEALDQAYAQAAQANAKTIVLNFKAVDYINSTGIALIVGMLAKSRKANRQMFVMGLSEHYMEIFKITRLSDFIKIVSDEAAVMQESKQ